MEKEKDSLQMVCGWQRRRRLQRRQQWRLAAVSHARIKPVGVSRVCALATTATAAAAASISASNFSQTHAAHKSGLRDRTPFLFGKTFLKPPLSFSFPVSLASEIIVLLLVEAFADKRR
jgi:hypothetical protein